MDTDASNGLGAGLRGRSEPPDHVPVCTTPFVEHFPSTSAGAPISNMTQSVPGLQDGLHAENIWYPFQSKRDWEFAQWSKNRGPGSTAVTELLAIDGVCSSQCAHLTAS